MPGPQILLIDADDTLWENNIYFEQAIGDFMSFLNQYGPALVDRLDEELPLDLGRHWVVTI